MENYPCVQSHYTFDALSEFEESTHFLYYISEENMRFLLTHSAINNFILILGGSQEEGGKGG